MIIKCKHCDRKLASKKNLRAHLEWRKENGHCPNRGPSAEAYFKDFERAIEYEEEKWSMLEDVEHMT